MIKYSDLLCNWLEELGYTKCFYVAGGNVMHLLESASKIFECVPFVHEVAAGIAAEFHNEGRLEGDGRAFVLVTAGPGLTNLVTAVAGSYLESRDLLILGGQVKSSDLKSEHMRQRGIQEIDGISLLRSITKTSIRINSPKCEDEIVSAVQCGLENRKGPVFLEVCLDVQATEVDPDFLAKSLPGRETVHSPKQRTKIDLESIANLLNSSKRPVLLLGGELSRTVSAQLNIELTNCTVPLLTTWNAADRIPSDQKNYFGRPDTWGMRYSNLILQQSDLILAVGARLSMQQTGFNFNEFAPNANIIHIFSDESEFDKKFSNTVKSIKGLADDYLPGLLQLTVQCNSAWTEWMEFCIEIKALLPLSEESNKQRNSFWNPYDFYLELSDLLGSGEALIPSSSGAAETVAMQAFRQASGVRVITNSSLASMGYGLAGAIGMSLLTQKRVCLVEGDGGFAQNLQELGTVERQKLNMKIFIFCNEGYASIRMTQKNYFAGNYLGCDRETGLGLPMWERLFESYGIQYMNLNPKLGIREQAADLWSNKFPAAFIVPIHPEQTYFPKITSTILPDGTMKSNPLHKMTPPLTTELESKVNRFI